MQKLAEQLDWASILWNYQKDCKHIVKLFGWKSSCLWFLKVNLQWIFFLIVLGLPFWYWSREDACKYSIVYYVFGVKNGYIQLVKTGCTKRYISCTSQMWAPPTPPHDDNDIYIDQSLLFLYEPNVMPETQLPPVYIKREHKKPKVESITSKGMFSGKFIDLW